MSETKQTSIPLRVTDEILKRIERHLERMKQNAPGVDLSRTDAVRMLLVQGLEVVEKRAGR